MAENKVRGFGNPGRRDIAGKGIGMVAAESGIKAARPSTEGLGVREWKNTDELKEARRQGNNLSRYARSGTPELEAAEEKASGLLGLRRENVVAFAYGMTAVVAALECWRPRTVPKKSYCWPLRMVVAALEYWRPRTGLVAIHGRNEYSRIKQYFSDVLVPRGVLPVEVDSYSIEGLADTIEKRRPHIVFLETVANGPDIPILDVKRFLEIPYLKAPGLLIVLDNTLAADRIRPEELIGNDLNTIVVESGTKFYTKNRSSVGFAYAKNPEIIARLRLLRTITGGAPDRMPAKLLEEDIVGPDEFSHRNSRIFRNARTLAELCASEVRPDSPFSVSYPNLAGHPNADFANERFPDGAAPLLFIRAKGNIDQYGITDALFSDPVIRDSCLVIESFGFDFTAIYPNDYTPLDPKVKAAVYGSVNKTLIEPNDYTPLAPKGKEPFVRISAGAEDGEKAKEIGNALRRGLRALSDIAGK